MYHEINRDVTQALIRPDNVRTLALYVLDQTASET